MGKDDLTYDGCNFLRQRLILSVLSGKTVKIQNIRHKEDNPGMQDFESSFIKLLEKVTNGSRIEVNETGTRLKFQPGLLTGGAFEHECSTQRSIGYYLEALVCLAPFCKKPIEATLQGVTNNQSDPSVDAIKNGTLPVLKMFLSVAEGLELKIVRRGLAPDGGGEVFFTCPISRQLKPIQFIDPGKIKRIRGVAFSARISPAITNRVVDSVKSVLLKFIPDVYIYTDHCKGVQSGKSPGYGLSLVAETTDGSFLTAEMTSNPAGSGKSLNVPEELGIETAHLLLEEIYRGGCVDSSNQSIACLFMVLGPQDVSKIQTGPLSPYTIQFLRHLKDFFQVMFKLDIQEHDEDDKLRTGTEKIILTCLGIRFTNLSKFRS